MDVNTRRLLLTLSFACVAGLALPSVNELLVVALLGVFVFVVYKNPMLLKKVDQNLFVKSLQILFPAFCILLVKVLIQSVLNSDMFSAVQGVIMALGLLLGGSYFICVVLADQKGVEPKKADISQNKIPVAVVVFYAVFAIVAMLFATQSSPLYPINYWDDSNIYRTVGECMVNGKVLYVDVHDQKGLFTYLMEIPGVLISRDSFFGMYVTETLVFFLYSLISLKIVGLFIKPNKTVWALVPVLSLITFTSNYFRYGGCIEELLLPLLTYAFYLGLKVVKTDTLFSLKDAFIIGLFSGWVFWSKYLDCGLFFGLIIFVIIYEVKKNQANKILPLAGSFLGGFLIICAIVACYFIVNNAFDTLFRAYFVGNISYAGFRQGTEDSTSAIASWVGNELTLFTKNFTYERLFYVFVYSGFAYLFIKKERRCLLYSAITYACAAFLIYGAGFCIEYYIVALKFFCAIGWIPFILLASKAMETIKSAKLSMAVTVYSVLVLTATLLVMCPAVFKLGTKREDIPQYRFADKINSVEDPKVLNFGFLDTGFFLGADILPYHNHYCTFSIYDQYGYEHLDKLFEGDADFVITDRYYEFEDYVICDQGSYQNLDFRGEIVWEDFYLYERAD